MIQIKSKQEDTPDSFEREVVGDEFHADLLPQRKIKKVQGTIAKGLGKRPKQYLSHEFPQNTGDLSFNL
jgi:hypothetical protein